MTSFAAELRLALYLWLVLGVVQRYEACLNTALRKGLLPASEEIARQTVSSGGDTCSCCGLCHQSTNCSSFSWNKADGQCRLFRSVASYSTLAPSQDWEYFVRMGRSQHHQFCRFDTDCQQSGDFCHGRVCTQLPSVTCRVIFQEFGAEDRFVDVTSRMYGWLGNRELQLACEMDEPYSGATRIFRNKRGFMFSKTTILSYNQGLPSLELAYSILKLADEIHRSGSAGSSKLWIVYDHSGELEEMSVSRDQQVVGSSPRLPADVTATHQSRKNREPWVIGLPYVLDGESLLLSVNAAPRLSPNTYQFNGALARADGRFTSWLEQSEYIDILLKE